MSDTGKVIDVSLTSEGEEIAAKVLGALADVCKTASEAKGFMRGNDGEAHALIHTEVAELTEAVRHGNPASEHIPEFSGSEEECADILIRVFDYCGKRDLRIGPAVIAKLKFNAGRPQMHGGKRF